MGPSVIVEPLNQPKHGFRYDKNVNSTLWMGYFRHMETLLVVYLYRSATEIKGKPTIMYLNMSGLFIGFYQVVDSPVGLRAMLNMQVAK